MLVEVQVAPDDLRRGRLGRAQLAEAEAAYRAHGLVTLHKAFDPAFIRRLEVAYAARFGGCSEDELARLGSRVGDERWMLSLPFEDPFDGPELYAPALLMPLLHRLLGEAVVLSSYCAVTSFPGAGPQHLHLDHPLLFPEDEQASLHLPPYATTVVIPLLDLDEKNGGTMVWPGSHRATPSFWKRVTRGTPLRLPAGSAFLMDYRLLHRGEANPGHLPRPVLYLVYARPWFRDAYNFRDHPPVRLSPEARARIPEAHQGLFAAALSAPSGCSAE
ncbi:MAG: phytanoyl-CoA dioxygenase family protein [Deltaproteobacteria bacterium]|nr:phytanoyl-CoA dioxygenase family protein [Deltaproteobacteria bacterium]